MKLHGFAAAAAAALVVVLAGAAPAARAAESADMTLFRRLCVDTGGDPDQVVAAAQRMGWTFRAGNISQGIPAYRSARGDEVKSYGEECSLSFAGERQAELFGALRAWIGAPVSIEARSDRAENWQVLVQAGGALRPLNNPLAAERLAEHVRRPVVAIRAAAWGDSLVLTARTWRPGPPRPASADVALLRELCIDTQADPARIAAAAARRGWKDATAELGEGMKGMQARKGAGPRELVVFGESAEDSDDVHVVHACVVPIQDLESDDLEGDLEVSFGARGRWDDDVFVWAWTEDRGERSFLEHVRWDTVAAAADARGSALWVLVSEDEMGVMRIRPTRR